MNTLRRTPIRSLLSQIFSSKDILLDRFHLISWKEGWEDTSSLLSLGNAQGGSPSDPHRHKSTRTRFGVQVTARLGLWRAQSTMTAWSPLGSSLRLLFLCSTFQVSDQFPRGHIQQIISTFPVISPPDSAKRSRISYLQGQSFNHQNHVLLPLWVPLPPPTF